jgi:hypothetical protein
MSNLSSWNRCTMGSLFPTKNRELIRLSHSRAVTEGSVGEVSVMGRRGDWEYLDANL